MRAIGVIGACVLLGACSTIIEGRSQQVVVNTNPPAPIADSIVRAS